MLDTNVFRGGNTSLKINAVSGTLVKNHTKSRFVVAKSNNEIFDEKEPRLSVGTSCSGHSYSRNIYEPCVVLQAMIIGEGLFLCEVVLEKDLKDGGYEHEEVDRAF